MKNISGFLIIFIPQYQNSVGFLTEATERNIFQGKAFEAFCRYG
jgi:hypothetical protein